jgi:hypothetical protein
MLASNSLVALSDDMADRDETYSDAETERRANATLKRMLATPPKTHKDSKLGPRRESGRKGA